MRHAREALSSTPDAQLDVLLNGDHSVAAAGWAGPNPGGLSPRAWTRRRHRRPQEQPDY
jgi:hypothetical protein